MLCFEPQGQLPVGDVMLAQKIALELFESKALRVANASPTWDWAENSSGRTAALARARPPLYVATVGFPYLART
jgi:hypothetical protein